jgi:hypothetical protein
MGWDRRTGRRSEKQLGQRVGYATNHEILTTAAQGTKASLDHVAAGLRVHDGLLYSVRQVEIIARDQRTAEWQGSKPPVISIVANPLRHVGATTIASSL